MFYEKNKGFIGLTQNYKLFTGFIGFAKRPGKGAARINEQMK